MFIVYISNGEKEQIIHVNNPDVRSPRLLNPVITNEVNAISNFEFDLVDQDIKLFEHQTTLRVYSDLEQKDIFEGRVYQISETMDSSGKIVRKVICESDLAFLLDTRARKFEFKDESVETILRALIENHNLNTDAHKQFQLGRVEFTERLYRSSEIFETTLGIIHDRFVSKLGGELIVEKINGVRTLHYLKSTGTVIPTPIRLGENMIDMELVKDLSGSATRLIPTARGENGEVITIESANGGKVYIDDTEAIKNYGIIETTENFEGITSPVTLLAKAKERLEEIVKIKRILKLNALDLSMLDRNIHSFNVGDDVPIINPLMGVDENFRVVKKTIDLHQPWRSSIEIANKYDTLTAKQVGMNSIANKVNNVMTGENVNSNYLQGSIDLLKNAMYATGEFQNAEVLEGKGIILENNMVESNAYGAMYFGPTGFSIAPTKVNGQWDWRTFGTGQGFVADYINAGTLNADLVNVTNLKGENIDAKRLTVYNDNGLKTLEIDAQGNVKLNAAEMNIAVGGQGNVASKEELDSAIKDAQDSINAEIGDVQTNLGSLSDYVDGAFKDGILDSTEKAAIAEHLRNLEKEKLDVDKQVDQILMTETITDEVANILNSIGNAKLAYDTTHNKLVATINAIINSEKIDSSMITILDTDFQNYAIRLADISTLIQQAIGMIAEDKIEKAKVEIAITTDSITQTVTNLETVVSKKPSRDDVMDMIENVGASSKITVISTNGDIFKQNTGQTYLITKVINNGEEVDMVEFLRTTPTNTTGYLEGSIIYTTEDDKYKEVIGGSWVTLSEPPSYENGKSDYSYQWFKNDTSFNPYLEEPIVHARGKILKVQASEVPEISNFEVKVFSQE